MLLNVEVPVGVEAADGENLGERDANGERNQFCDERYNVNTGVSQ